MGVVSIISFKTKKRQFQLFYVSLNLKPEELFFLHKTPMSPPLDIKCVALNLHLSNTYIVPVNNIFLKVGLLTNHLGKCYLLNHPEENTNSPIAHFGGITKVAHH